MKLLPTDIDIERANALREVLGVPAGKECGLTHLKFKGPLLELFLVAAGDEPPTDAMLYLDKPLPFSEETAYQIWRVRIYREGAPLYSEMTWTPAQRYQYAIRSKPTTKGSRWKQADLDRAWADLRRWQALEERRVGRPAGPGMLSRLTANEVLEEYQSLADANGSRPSQEMLAEHFLVSAKTLRNKLKELGVPWPPS